MAIKTLLPPTEMLRKRLRYDAETGLLFWLPATPDLFKDGGKSAEHVCKIWNAKHANKRATSPRSDRYLGIRIGGGSYYQHRIIWKLVHDEEPDTIDHINGDTFDNRLSNLRNVSAGENMRNMKLYKNNSSGRAGVRWCKGFKRWQARYDQRYLGTFDSFEDAVRAREAEEKRIGHINRPAQLQTAA